MPHANSASRLRTARASRYAVGRLVTDEMIRQGVSRTDLARRLGYVNITKALRRVDALLQRGHEPVILPKIARALGVEQHVLDKAVAETQAELLAEEEEAERQREAQERATFTPYVLVETERRVPQPIHVGVMGYEVLKRIRLPQITIRKTLPEQVEWVSRAVVRHYSHNDGRVPAFGRITGYSYRRTFDDALAFDVNGRVTNYFAKRPVEGRGWLAVKGRRLPPSIFISATPAR